MKGTCIIWGTIQAAFHALESRAQCTSAHKSRLQRSFSTRQSRLLTTVLNQKKTVDKLQADKSPQWGTLVVEAIGAEL